MNQHSAVSNSQAEAEWQARVDLAAAHRLAVMYGLHEAIDNHFTLLVPGYDDRFLLAPHGLHWSEVRASDLMVVGLDGTRHAGEGLIEDTAFFIHAPVHASPGRPRCVLHTHMPQATALSMLDDPLLVMASQNAIGFWGRMAVCDYNGFALGRDEGERMVAAMGDKSVLILRNHGVVTTGASVAEAFNDLYFFERAAETQLLALASGQPLRVVPESVIEHTYAQYRESEAVGDALRIELHFAALKRILDRRGEDYAS
ncbi:MAG: aldolase [Proteobacteria bacterium]|nr:aldolase [Pseudomonadota bacterium]